MKYVIIGAGGTGGIIGAYMTRSGKDVTLIARGRHLEAIQKNGLKIERIWTDIQETVPVRAMTMEEYVDKADVVLVCVKGYSLDETIPFIKKISHDDTVVIPVLNIYGTGGHIQESLPDILVTDGCIYVSANIKEPGVLLQHGKICKIVFGLREKDRTNHVLEKVVKDFGDSGIDGILSENIKRDALQKFSYVSPIGAAGLYCNAVARDFQKEGEPREMFKSMIREITAIADAMGIQFEEDLVDVNIKILRTLAPEATTSMQRDVLEGKDSEIDGLVFEVVRLGRKYNVPVPNYEKVAIKLGFKQ
ncbi:MAG: 2-dehydropantoate 2-reductase [Firmicutes bacterium]|jgi:2-dehydropantoate 2-reductase|nr:2-dehydropantoate 2-reductase [Bacillota bacterium]